MARFAASRLLVCYEWWWGFVYLRYRNTGHMIRLGEVLYCEKIPGHTRLYHIDCRLFNMGGRSTETYGLFVEKDGNPLVPICYGFGYTR